MPPILVGDPEAPIGTLVLAITQPPTDFIVQRNWSILAMSLDIPMAVQDSLTRDLILHIANIQTLVAEVLTRWRSQQGANATVNKLLDILELECNWIDTADRVWEITHRIILDSMSWNDLHRRTQNKILQRSIKLMGKTESIKKHFENVGTRNWQPFLDNMSCDIIRELLAAGENDYVVSTTAPELIPSYYISRILTSNHELDPIIYMQDANDIFVISGISQTVLYDLAGNESIEMSLPLKSQYLSRFILLVNFSEYGYVKSVCPNVPVHHILYAHGKHYWMETQGNMNLILEHLRPDKRLWSEASLLKMIQTDTHHKTIVIADCPGMGKSLLLASLYNALPTDGPTIKLYIVLSELNNKDKIVSKDACKPLDPTAATAELVTKSIVGQYILLHLLNDISTHKYIFLDAFDEVNINKQPDTCEFINRMGMICNTTIIISSRLHKMQELGNNFHTLPYKILPIGEQQQKELILGYWKREINEIDNTLALQYLAEQITDKAIITNKSDDTAFAGVPLQCRMLAEIYLEVAKTYSAIQTPPEKSMIQSFEIFELYSKLVRIKFSRVVAELREQAFLWHVSESIRILFPDQHENFLKAKNFGLPTSSNEIINKIGICTLTDNSSNTKFVHLSYAEFFSASWILELSSFTAHEAEIHLQISILLEKVLNPVRYWTSENLNGLKDISILYEYWKTHPMADACRDKWVPLMEAMGARKEIVYQTQRRWTIERENPLTRNRSDSDILFIMMYMLTSMARKAFPITKLISALEQVNLREVSGYLEEKYYKADFARGTIATLVNSGYQKQVDQAGSDSVALPASRSTSDTMLVSYNMPKILESCMRHDQIQLFHFLINDVIRDYLSEMTVDWINIIKQACQHSSITTVKLVFHVARTVAKVNMEQLSQNLLREKIYNDIALRGSFEIFAYAFKNFRPSSEDLEGFMYSCLSNSAELSDYDVNDRISILEVALKSYPELINQVLETGELPLHVSHTHVDILKLLIRKGADVYSKDIYDRTCAHLVAECYSGDMFHSFCQMMLVNYKNIFAIRNIHQQTPLQIALLYIQVQARTIRLLVSENVLDVTDTGQSLLNLAIEERQKMGVFDELKRAGVNIHRQLDTHGTFLLHFAARVGNIDAITYLVLNGMNINVRDNDNLTPLHFAISQHNRNIHHTVKHLIEMNADTNAVDLHGRSALYFAENGADGAIVQERTISLLKETMRAKLSI